MTSETAGPAVVIASETLGSGDDELGAVLMRAFVKTLAKVDARPSAVIFQNGGVRHTLEGAALLEDVRALEALGVPVLVCGTCLDWFGAKDRLAAGAISNMHDILTLLLAAPSVIRP